MFWTLVGAILFVFVGLPIIITIVMAILGMTIEHTPFLWRWFFAALIGFFLMVIYTLVVHFDFSSATTVETILILLIFYALGYGITTAIMPKRTPKKTNNQSQPISCSKKMAKSQHDNIAEAILVDKNGRVIKPPHITDNTNIPRGLWVFCEILFVIIAILLIVIIFLAILQ